MVEKGTSLFRILDGVADSVIPVLGIILLLLLIRGTIQKEIEWRRWAGIALGIATVYILKTLEKRLHIWESLGGDYSSHSALTVAVMVPLIYIRPKWLLPLIGVFVAYAALMVVLAFHSILDITTTLAAVVPLVLLANRFLGRGKTVSAVE